MSLITSTKNFITNHSEFLPAVGLLTASVATEVATTNPRFTLITGATSTAVGFYGLVDTTKKLWNKTQHQNESLFDNTRLLAKGSLYLMAFGFGLYQLANYDQLLSKLFANNQLLEKKVQTLETTVNEQKETASKTNQLLTEKSDFADQVTKQLSDRECQIKRANHYLSAIKGNLEDTSFNFERRVNHALTDVSFAHEVLNNPTPYDLAKCMENAEVSSK